MQCDVYGYQWIVYLSGSYTNPIIIMTGFYDRSMVKDMLKECSRMSEFKHINVLTLQGVCLDGGPAPYIIMPFMANGSLLTYLKRNRKTLAVSYDDQENYRDDVSNTACFMKLMFCKWQPNNFVGGDCPQATDGHVYSSCQRNGVSCEYEGCA